MVTVLEPTTFSMHAQPLKPCSDYDLDDDPDIRISYSTGFWRSTDNIESWAAEVQEAISLPPLTIIPESQGLSYKRRQSHQRNSFFKISSPIPRETFNAIRRQLVQPVNSQDTVTLLEQLPDPELQPLVSYVIPHSCIRITNIKNLRPWRAARM